MEEIIGTVTGRWTGSTPNLKEVPKSRPWEGKKVAYTDKDNTILGLAIEELNLTKFRGMGGIPPKPYQNIPQIVLLDKMLIKNGGWVLLEDTNFADFERRVLGLCVEDLHMHTLSGTPSGDDVVGFSRYSLRDIERAILGHDHNAQKLVEIDSMRHALRRLSITKIAKQEKPKKPPKHYEHMNKKTKGGKW